MHFQSMPGWNRFNEVQHPRLSRGMAHQNLKRFFQRYPAKVCFMLSEGVSYWYIINVVQLN
jgi:hypothetical protein